MDSRIKALRDNLPNLGPRDKNFASSLLDQYYKKRRLSPKQWPYVEELAERSLEQDIKERKADEARRTKNLGGTLMPMVVMFRLVGTKPNAPKRPRVRLITEDGVKFMVYEAPKDGKNAGWYYVKGSEYYGNYYGKIDPKTGNFVKSWETPESVVKALEDFCQDPVQAATAYGRRTSSCCFCNRTLTDTTSGGSIERGYGPVCADNFGLPHGAEVPVQTVNTINLAGMTGRIGG